MDELEWFRYYVETLNDPKVQLLPADLFKTWVNLLCIARQHDGNLPATGEIAFRLRMSEETAAGAIQTLADAELLDTMPGGGLRPHNWDTRQYTSDTSTPRVRRHRETGRKRFTKRPDGVSETPPEQSRYRADADAEQSRTTTSSDGAPPSVPRNGSWQSDEAFVRFREQYMLTGAALIDEDFVGAFWHWARLSWEDRAERVKALGTHMEEYRGNPAFVPKPRKFLEQEWRRPLRPTPVQTRALTATEQAIKE